MSEVKQVGLPERGFCRIFREAEVKGLEETKRSEWVRQMGSAE